MVYVTFCALLLVFCSVCTIAVPSNCPLPVLLASPVMFGLSTTVHVYLMPLVVVWLLTGKILVAVLLHIVSLTAAITTVGSTHTSISMKLNGQALLSLLSLVCGVIL